MGDEFLRPGSLAVELATAGGVLGVFLLATVFVKMFWMRILGPFVRRLHPELDDVILKPARSVVLWGLLLLGLYYSLDSLEVVKSNAKIVGLMSKVFGVAWVGLAAMAALKLMRGLIDWYVRSVAKRPDGARDISQEASLVRMVGTILVIAFGGLYMLWVAGVDITPLLASGAIGGLAVALALQDTLSNLFGGFFIAVDRPIRVGDFIKLESGDAGFVDEIGWRSTKIRLLENNVVVIPNSKLSQSVVTNYFLPRQDMSLVIPCGVAYDSDLQRVEQSTIQVAKEVMGQVKGSDPEWPPEVRWKEFGDSAITFDAVLRVKEFEAQHKLKSEFIKALHTRFNQEGIEIPFPMRTVVMKSVSEDVKRGS